jgi:hypothetical protein
MVEIVGSDNLVYETTLSLQVKGVSGFHVETAGRRNVYSCDDFKAIFYNPNRRTVTFCTQDGQYYTFNTTRTRLAITRGDSSHAISKAQDIINKSK